MQVQQMQDPQNAFTNKVFCSQTTKLKYGNFVQLNQQQMIYQLQEDETILQDYIVLNLIQRTQNRIGLTDKVTLQSCTQALQPLQQTTIQLKYLNPSTSICIDNKDFITHFININQGLPCAYNQQFLVRYKNKNIVAIILNQGIITQNVQVTLQSIDQNIELQQDKEQRPKGFDFQLEDIGGLKQELKDLLRKAFSSRKLSQLQLEKLGIRHAKGILLYGPPGCGKTLIARSIAQALNSKNVKIVNGPSILSEYVGKSEQNIRDLFKEAIQDQQTLSYKSPLHVIIFDEIDAICRKRGKNNTSSDLNDRLVNQLLTMIDGPEQLNNVLIIGMTNMKELLDPALIRAGRLEYHFQITLPNKEERKEILQIHTKQMIENKMTKDLDLNYLAVNTEFYSGAMLEQLVKLATSLAVQREQEEIIVLQQDFIDAMKDIQF